MKNNVGQKIKKLRELRNYTQAYMAIELDMTQQGYSKIEKEGRLSVAQLDQIADILKVDSAYILNFNEEQLIKQNYDNPVGLLSSTIERNMPHNDSKFYAEMIMLLRKEVDCLYAIAFPAQKEVHFQMK